MKLDESKVQSLIYADRSKNCSISVPNFFFGHGESDFLVITTAGVLWEFEIKLSRSDFLSEMRSAAGMVLSSDMKHQISVATSKWRKHQRLKAREPFWTPARKQVFCPNHYTFVAPKGMILLNEVPEYAGLMEICQEEQTTSNGRKYQHTWLHVTKKAPRLHKEQPDMELRLRMGRGMMYRYYTMKGEVRRLERELEKLKKS